MVRWEPSSPPPKKGQSFHPILGTFLLWPNGWMHQDATLYRGRPHPRRHCVILWEPGSPPPKKKGGEHSSSPLFGPKTVQPVLSDRCLSCLSVTLVYCGQMVGWIGMPLGMELPWYGVTSAQAKAPPTGHSPQFSAHVCCGQMAGWIKFKMRLGT